MCSLGGVYNIFVEVVYIFSLVAVYRFLFGAVNILFEVFTCSFLWVLTFSFFGDVYILLLGGIYSFILGGVYILLLRGVYILLL